MAKGKEVATVQDNAALTLAQDLGIEFNVLDTVTKPKLPRIKINRDLLLFTPEDGEPTKVIEGHILAISNVKVWWRDEYSGQGGVMPDCMAIDSTRPDPRSAMPQASSCLKCKWNEFGSSRKPGSNGKDCADRKRILFLADDHNLPYVLDIPAMGISAVERFCVTYAGKAGAPPLPLAHLKVTLEQVKSRNGQTGSAPVFEVVEYVSTREEAERIAAALKTFAAQFKEETIMDAEVEEVSSAGNASGATDDEVPF